MAPDSISAIAAAVSAAIALVSAVLAGVSWMALKRQVREARLANQVGAFLALSNAFSEFQRRQDEVDAARQRVREGAPEAHSEVGTPLDISRLAYHEDAACLDAVIAMGFFCSKGIIPGGWVMERWGPFLAYHRSRLQGALEWTIGDEPAYVECIRGLVEEAVRKYPGSRSPSLF